MEIQQFIRHSFLVLMVISLISCHRADEDEDVLSQEDISNIILRIQDTATGNTEVYNYTLNSAINPVIKLRDGGTYNVEAIFKNGNEDETESIKRAKDEHFIIFDFQNSHVDLERTDDDSSTRSDGVRVGLHTKWHVLQAESGVNPKLILTLIHDATSVSEQQNGGIFGVAVGGETDALATFDIRR